MKIRISFSYPGLGYSGLLFKFCTEICNFGLHTIRFYTLTLRTAAVPFRTS